MKPAAARRSRPGDAVAPGRGQAYPFERKPAPAGLWGDMDMAKAKVGIRASNGALTLVLHRGERMCLIGMNVDPAPADDFVGFAVEVRSPKSKVFWPLRNRLAFDYPDGEGVTGFRQHPTVEAPLQTFRWIHFPQDTHEGTYLYRVTMIHMAPDGALSKGLSATAGIGLCDETVPGVVDIGFTRNFASSQAFSEKFPDEATRKLILPASSEDGLAHDKSKAPAGVYDFLGGKANNLLQRVLARAKAEGATLDVMAFDLNEPDFLAALEAVAKRGSRAAPTLRILIDNSRDHAGPESAESQAAERLEAAGAAVVRHHFSSLQHNKVLVLREGGQPTLAIGGSTNFSFRGLYIQANNLLLFSQRETVALFAEAFEIAFRGAAEWEKNPFKDLWHALAAQPGLNIRACFSPHRNGSDLSLSPVVGAIEQASSSVLYAVAFLNQDTKGPVRKALDRLVERPLFSYGIANRKSALKLVKPDGSQGVVDFKYLASHAPEPFRTEWGGGAGITIHHKYVVVDFNLPTAKVFAGSSNLSFSGEEGNGDHLVQIGDARVATAYAVEALRMFDHLNFRTRMSAAGEAAKRLSLKKPPAAGEKAWFAPFYEPASQKARDRELFSAM